MVSKQEQQIMGLISNLLSARKKQKAVTGDEQDQEMSFLDHLEELRWHLIRIIAVVFVLSIVVFTYIEKFINLFILYPFTPEFPINKWMCQLNKDLCFEKIDVIFIAISPYEQFLMAFSVSIIASVIIAFPYIVWEIWRFIKPGLHPHEQKKLRGNVLVISFLFFMGVLFSYYVVTPFSVSFLSQFKLAASVQNQWKIGDVIDLVTQITLGGAIIFELPIVVYYLSKLGVLTPDFMRQYRRHAIVILLVIAAIITPPDVLSQIMIFIPLVILYEVSVIVCAVVVRNKAKELKEEEAKSAV